MTELVAFLLIFVAVGVGFVFVNLMLGRLIRPARPDPEKETIYECGEPSIGSAWIQFDLRFYVVALLFVIFDVEMAFFFPWAVVFGTANRVADAGPEAVAAAGTGEQLLPPPAAPAPEPAGGDLASAGRRLAWIAFADIAVFFGVLLVGFAYLWRRGDLDWVRSTAGQAEAPVRNQPGALAPGGR
jgi:NADH-quinone oxidoreductase subunit A